MLLQTCEKTFAMLLKATVMQVKKNSVPKKKLYSCVVTKQANFQ